MVTQLGGRDARGPSKRVESFEPNPAVLMQFESYNVEQVKSAIFLTLKGSDALGPKAAVGVSHLSSTL